MSNKTGQVFVKKSVAGLPDMPDMGALYAKTSHPNPYCFSMRGILSAPSVRAGVLGTQAKLRLHRRFRQKAVRRGRRQILSQEDCSSVCETTLAKQAGQELVKNYGFKKLPVSDPYEAPVGSVLVYDAKRAAGHVEIRTEDGFVSDFRSKTPSRRPLLGVFAKS